MEIKLRDGRTALYAGDTDCQLILAGFGDEQVEQVQFEDIKDTAGSTMDVEIERDGEELVCDIPNQLLDGTYSELICYVVAKFGEGLRTIADKRFAIKPRQLSSGYVIDPTKVLTWNEIIEQAEAARDSAKESAADATESAESAAASATASAASESASRETLEQVQELKEISDANATATASDRTVVEQLKADITSDITQAKSNIATAKKDAVDTIATAKTDALDELESKRTSSLSDIDDAKEIALDAISLDKDSAIQAISAQEASSIKAVQTQQSKSEAILKTYEESTSASAASAKESATQAALSASSAATSAAEAEASAQRVDNLKDNVAITVDESNSRLYHMSFFSDEVASFEVPADKFLKSVSYDSKKSTLSFTFVLADESESVVNVDISSLVDTYTAGNGLTLSNNQFALKVKSGETHLKADSNGVYTDLSDKSDIGHTHAKSEITDFSHTHDDRYYTESEMDDKLSNIDTALESKSDIGHTHAKSEITDFSHTHDDRYYTESEVDNKLATKSDTTHNHDDRYFTETEVTTKLAGKSDTDHTHDTRYYTKSEIDDKIAGSDTDLTVYYTKTEIDEKVTAIDTAISEKADESHTHTKSDITDFPSSLPASDVSAWAKAAVKPTYTYSEVGAAAEEHTHDDRYYTESETDSKFTAAETKLQNNVAISQDTTNTLKYNLSIYGSEVASFTIPADRFLKSVSYSEDTGKLTFVFVTSEGESTLAVDISSLIDVYTAGVGLTLADNQFSLKIKSGESHLKADVNGAYIDLSDKSDVGHTHDDRYFTETEVTTKLAGKSDTDHTHDDRYYTESEIDTKVSALNTSIATKQTSALVTAFQTTPDDTHYPSEKLVKTQLDTKATTTALTAHTGNTSNPHSVTKAQVGLGNVLNVASYSKDEVDSKVSALSTEIDGKSDTGHTHTKSDITDFPTSLPASDVSAWAKATTKPAYTYSEVGAAAESHTHDDRYYTESEVDTKLSSKADTSNVYSKTEMDTKLETLNNLPFEIVDGVLCWLVEE